MPMEKLNKENSKLKNANKKPSKIKDNLTNFLSENQTRHKSSPVPLPDHILLGDRPKITARSGPNEILAELPYTEFYSNVQDQRNTEMYNQKNITNFIRKFESAPDYGSSSVSNLLAEIKQTAKFKT